MSNWKYVRNNSHDATGANSHSEAYQFGKIMKFFAGGSEGGFLPKKEPSEKHPQEIYNYFWQLL
jgi:hypothetical protein